MDNAGNGRAKTLHRGSLAALMALCLLLGGCQPAPDAAPEAAQTHADTAEATPAPEVSMQPQISPDADTEMLEQREVTLYYRMAGETLLGAETRTVYLPRDKLVEQVLVEALIGGPSPNLLELTSLFDSGTAVRVWSSESLLTVQLSREFLANPVDAPATWEFDERTQAEVYHSRMLALASIVSTITEATDYTAVQFMVLDRNDELTGRRLLRGEIYQGAPQDQVLPPMARNEALMLTHNNSAQVIMESWKARDFERLYRFVAQEDASRPTDAAFVEEMEALAGALTMFSLSAGAVTEDGQRAVLSVSFEYVRAGKQVSLQSFPLRLVRENGLWKISYAELLRLMEAL